MELKAYAKLNLTLELLSKRDDGYHEICSILQSISIADSLYVEPAEGLSLDGDAAGVASEDNLVLRAARLLQAEGGTRHGARLTLKKRIPIAAGLGGGSSDAAAALRGLNELWGLGMGTKDLQELGARLGSDVPFFVDGGTALVQGRGENITPLPPPPEAWFVLGCISSSIPNKTATLYKGVNQRLFTYGQRTHALAADITAGTPIAASYFVNAFEPLAFATFPGLAEVHDEMLHSGAADIHLSGSGPALFCMVPNEAKGWELIQRCDRRGLPVYLVKTVAKTL